MAAAGRQREIAWGLAELRRAGAASELLFLYECATQPVRRLRTVADRLGLTVQAASHLYRQLASRGLVRTDQGEYRPTVEGVSWLHRALTELEGDLARRRERLRIVRTALAIAGERIPPGARVRLELSDGVLVARRGASAGSQGIARAGAENGELVEVAELSGIVAIPPATIYLVVVPTRPPPSVRDLSAARAAVRRFPHGLVGAQGTAAVYLTGRLRLAPVRFGFAAAALEAVRLGVSVLGFIEEEELPRFLATFTGLERIPIRTVRLDELSRPGSHRRPGRRRPEPTLQRSRELR